jgi:hypothetical protein
MNDQHFRCITYTKYSREESREEYSYSRGNEKRAVGLVEEIGRREVYPDDGDIQRHHNFQEVEGIDKKTGCNKMRNEQQLVIPTSGTEGHAG